MSSPVLDMSHEEQVKYLIENHREREDARHQFGLKHGFYFKRPQNYKNCIVIRWKHRRRKDKDFIDYDRIDAYHALCRMICERFQLDDPRDLLLEPNLKLYKIGIYSFIDWDRHVWAIPNEFADIQQYVLERLPKWAEVRMK